MRDEMLQGHVQQHCEDDKPFQHLSRHQKSIYEGRYSADGVPKSLPTPYALHKQHHLALLWQ